MRYFKLQLEQHHLSVSLPTIKKYLRTRKISLKGAVKQLSTRQHAQRDLQFQQIAKLKHEFLATGKPVISIDTKKKEQLGLFKSMGRLWKKVAQKVFDHDFPSLSSGKVIPFGIYDLKYNRGYVYVGTSHETPRFLAEMLSRWWKDVGRLLYLGASELLILCDAGGSNGYRVHG